MLVVVEASESPILSLLFLLKSSSTSDFKAIGSSWFNLLRVSKMFTSVRLGK
jgi:hypothetical protein